MLFGFAIFTFVVDGFHIFDSQHSWHWYFECPFQTVDLNFASIEMASDIVDCQFDVFAEPPGGSRWAIVVHVEELDFIDIDLVVERQFASIGIVDAFQQKALK